MNYTVATELAHSAGYSNHMHSILIFSPFHSCLVYMMLTGFWHFSLISPSCGEKYYNSWIPKDLLRVRFRRLLNWRSCSLSLEETRSHHITTVQLYGQSTSVYIVCIYALQQTANDAVQNTGRESNSGRLWEHWFLFLCSLSLSRMSEMISGNEFSGLFFFLFVIIIVMKLNKTQWSPQSGH
jgi:hypothetical protein